MPAKAQSPIHIIFIKIIYKGPNMWFPDDRRKFDLGDVKIKII